MASIVDRLRAKADDPERLALDVRAAVRAALVAVVALGLGTAGVAFLESPAVGIADASPLYLVAVVAVGILAGTRAAVATAVAAFAVYDVVFTEPRFTFLVADPREWLDLLLLLFVALAIGQLAARETARAREATGRARESEALFAISRTLATSANLREAAPLIVDRLAADARMSRVWIGLQSGTAETILADTRPTDEIPLAGSVWSLARTEVTDAPRWIAVHALRPGMRPAISSDSGVWAVRLEAGGVWVGTLRGLRGRTLGPPTREETRLLALAADQLALALRREQLSREATEAEIARQSDALKSALLDSVSHDLRTPLASIRATAGSLIDPAVEWSDAERRAAAGAIDAEAERLSGLVQNVLDLSRIQGGALHPDLEVLDPREVVEPVVSRVEDLLDGRRVVVDVEGLPPIRADAVLLDTVLTNLIENAIRHGGKDAPVRVRGLTRDGRVEIVVEDGGQGVPDEVLPRLFGKFYRVPGRAPGSRRGLGIGLSIVRGFVEAMGGSVTAERSDLGGLAIRVSLPIAPEPPQR
jgi:two-component system sensor histidine kinase KdpD